MTYVKKGHRKLYLALILVIVLSIAGFAAAYAVLSAPKPVVVGVHVGDTFTYSITGTSDLTGAGAVDTPGFSAYNETDYYKITITGINGSQVSMDTSWKFKNGTEINSPQTLDIGSGQKSDENGFWALYPANLEKTDLLRPRGYDNTRVNNTDTFTYSSGARGRCFWFINNEFFNVNDPTRSTLMYDYRNIFFDKATGMLTSFADYQFYNTPEMQEVITWTLVSTSVWQV
jgi:hypothetical protein